MFNFSKKRKASICDIKPATDFSELKKRTRILVIDDKQEEFPFKILTDEGYSIECWTDVKELEKLETGFYDIIILDIGGVGLAYDENNEGVGILKHIKSVNPSQIVVAFSGQAHESSRIPFFQLADQYIPKPASALNIKEMIDDLIKNKLTIQYFWNSLCEMLKQSGITKKQVDQVEKLLLNTINSGNSNEFRDKFFQIISTVDNGMTLLSIGLKIIGFA